MGCLKFVVSAVALMLGAIFLITAMGNPTPDRNAGTRAPRKAKCDDGYMAYAKAERAVKAALKAPSTAKFPGYSSVQISVLPNCQYIVMGYVDAQNSFGAMIRSSFAVKLQEFDNDRWDVLGVAVE